MRPLKHPSMADIQIEHVLHALSDSVRLGIVRQLAREGELTCAALLSGRPKSSMSYHFRILHEAGLVLVRQEGTQHQNSLRRAEIERRFPGLLDAVLADAAAAAARPKRRKKAA